jgi:DNA-directed RNA polymerase specialized sigma24 family protein
MHAPRENVPGLFPTTRWTIVRRLVDGEPRVSLLAWDDFVISYQQPLRSWLATRCRDVCLAEELVQAFLVKIQSRQHSISELDAAKGRLRSWLLVSLKRHWIDHLRREGAPKSQIPDDLAAVSTADDDNAFDLEWALSIARRVLSRIRDEYAARDSAALFAALLEAIDTDNRQARADRCKTLGMLPNTFSVALMRFRERLLIRLREEVAATLIGDDPAEIDGELRHLIAILSRHGDLASIAPVT